MNNGGDLKAPSDFQLALNCVRLITRIVPFLFEDQSDNFVDSVFWLNLLPASELKGLLCIVATTKLLKKQKSQMVSLLRPLLSD